MAMRDRHATAHVKVNSGSYFVLSPRTTYRKRWSSDARKLIIRLPRRTVEQLSSAESAEQPSSHLVIERPCAQCRRLTD
jgi:hypothetical protein